MVVSNLIMNIRNIVNESIQNLSNFTSTDYSA